MSSQKPSPQDQEHLVWFCRRLAAVLQNHSSLLVALDTIATGATPDQRLYLTPIRKRVNAGAYLSDALLPHQAGTLQWKILRNGESRDDLAGALTALADWLEVRATYPASPTRLQAYAMAFCHLGFFLSLRIPILSALESAAEVPDRKVAEVFNAARVEVSEGVTLPEAFARLAPDLPPLTIEMIADGDEEGRVDFALSVVADYLFDQATEAAPATQPQEVSHGK